MRGRDTVRWIAALSLSWLTCGGPTTAWAQPSLPTVAVLRATGAEGSRADLMFREALRSIGHEDGRTINIVGYAANNDPTQLPSLAARIVASRPSVVIAIRPASARAIKAASASLPIVAFTSFPVEAGLAASLVRPGGNLTGVSLITTEMDPKRLSLLAEFAPMAKRIGVLRDRTMPANHLPELHETALSLGIVLDVVEVARPEDISVAVALVKGRGAQALNVLASPMLNGSAGEVAERARLAGLPTVCQWREMAEAGCSLSYGPSFMEGYRLTAAQMDRILRGANPAELPIQQPTRFELVVNLKAAEAAGLTIPPTLLARADEVIE